MAAKDNEIAKLQGKIGVVQSREVPKLTYKAVKGDPIDEMLADYIRKTGCLVPITRLGGGFYMFGTKKIYCKIMNGKLVVRVGGGYMMIEEFILSLIHI